MMNRIGRIACAGLLTASAVAATQSATPVAAATINVTAGDAASLRAAVDTANANPVNADVILIPAGVYELDCTTTPENANASGDLDIYGETTLSGPASGAATITIDPTCGERVIDVRSGITFPTVIENLTVTGGNETAPLFVPAGQDPGNGGGIKSGGAPIVVDNSIVTGNQAGPGTDGGGIWSSGPVTIRNGSEVTNNQAGDAPPGPTRAGGDGGGIFTLTERGDISIENSTVSRNASGNGVGTSFGSRAGYGGGIYTQTDADLTITGSVIDGNTLGSSGDGALGGFSTGGGIATRNFSATNDPPPGLVRISDTTISNNVGGSSEFGGGGGAWVEHADIEISTSRVTNNSVPQALGGESAGHGGGLAVSTFKTHPFDITLIGNTFDGNAVATPAPTTSIFGPSGGNGGGIYIDADSGVVELIENTFDGNRAGDSASGSGGGGLAGSGGNVYIDLIPEGSETPTPGSITIRGGAIRNGETGGGATGFAGRGGGAYLVAGTDIAGGTIVIDDVEVTGNTSNRTLASASGGGVYALSFVDSGTAGSITVDGVTASNNTTLDGFDGSGAGGGPGAAMYLQAQGTSSGPTVSVIDSTFVDNATGSGADNLAGTGGFGGRGGAVYIWAPEVLVAGSTFTDNSTGDGGDGDINPGFGGNGGALFTTGAAVAIETSTFTGNSTGDGGSSATLSGGRAGSGGGFYAEAAGAIDIVGSTITENSTGNGASGAVSGGSGGKGGGLALDVTTAGADVSISDTTIADNAAGDGSPGDTDRAGTGGDGGGAHIQLNGGTATLDAVRIERNDAGDGADATGPSGATGGFGGDGGGVYLRDLDRSGSVAITGSTIAHNTAGDAGGSANDTPGVPGDGGGLLLDVGNIPTPMTPGFGTGDINIERTTISGNTAGAGGVGTTTTDGGKGGGAFLRTGEGNPTDIAITRSTIHDNDGGPSAIPTSRRGDGGGVYIDPGAAVASFDHVTITDNDGLNGVNLLTRAGNNTFVGTVIGEKADRDLENCNAIGVTITSLGYNLEASEGGFTCGFGDDTDIAAESPELGPLADNGGPTLTRLPIFDSPLIDQRPCSATTDQRGVAAPAGDACDIGATESDFAELMVTTDPARFADTRSNGDTFDDRFEADGKRGAATGYEVQIAGRGDVPADAIGAILNVTAIGATGNGFVTVHPCLPTPPLASSLNHTAGVNLGNEIIAGLDSSGNACFFTSASVHLTVDVVGYIPAGSPYTALTPGRILDTRDNGAAKTVDGQFEGEGRTGNGSTMRLDIAGRGGVPTDAQAAVINITAIGVQRNGFVTVFPCGPNLPVAASLNYTVGANRGNELIVQLDDAGRVCIFTSSPINLTVDVVGHIPGGSSVKPTTPQRLLDTRDTAKPSAGNQLRLQITGPANREPGVPTGSTAAIVNVTAVQPERVGFVTVHPCLPTQPNASSLNYVTNVNGGNEIIAQLSDTGELCLFTSGSTHITVDIVGYLQ